VNKLNRDFSNSFKMLALIVWVFLSNLPHASAEEAA
jgi:hypothetical protein